MEVEQPGELRLMRKLSGLRKEKATQDPFVSTTVSRKSPVLASIAKELNISLRSLESYEDGGKSKIDHPSIRAVREHGHDTPVKKGFLGPLEVTGMESRCGWGLGGAVAAEQQGDSHLQSAQIAAETGGLIPQEHCCDAVVLQNWMNIAGSKDDEKVCSEGQPATAIAVDWDRSDLPFMKHYEEFFHPNELQDVTKRRSSHKTSRTKAKGERHYRQSTQILSHLVPNSHHNMRCFGQPRPLFNLEEPYDADEQSIHEDFLHGTWALTCNKNNNESSVHKTRSRSQSPLAVSARSQRLSKKLSGHADDVVAGGMLSARMMPWEAEFFEYEVNTLELPRRSSHRRSRSQKQGIGQSAELGAAMPPNSTRTLRKKSYAKAERKLRTQQHPSASNALPNKTMEADPLPLLTELEDYSRNHELLGSSVDDEGGGLSMSELHGELELEVFNAADGHDTARSMQVMDKDMLQLAVPECKELVLCEYQPRNLSQKYRPKSFEDVIGQNIVTQALSNAVLKGKIAPVYLFQGPRGTGKTSAARIFAAALICAASESRRPCAVCRECISVATGKCSEVKEVDAASNNGIERVKALLDETISAPSLSRYKVFIIDECHVLTTETWNAILKILEEPPMNVVFILITTDPDQLPRTAMSRCQKFPFPKIKDSDIVKRLQKLASMENLEIDCEALQIIASRSDGSLRDAETTLDQVSLLGEHANSASVYELVGSASDEKLLSLLDAALLADTVNTVQRAKQLIDSGVEPLSLMSQLATLIMDILAGSYKFSDSERRGFFRKQHFSEEKLERLRMAMKILSEAEKQLRVSNERATWLTAALLQLGPDRSFMLAGSCPGTSVTQSPVVLEEAGSPGRKMWDGDSHVFDGDSNVFEGIGSELKPSNSELVSKAGNKHFTSMSPGIPWSMCKGDEMSTTKSPERDLRSDRSLTKSESSPSPLQAVEKASLGELLAHPSDAQYTERMLSPTKLDDIWYKVVESCQPHALRQLLYAHGKLMSILMSEVDAIVHLEVCYPEHKSRCEKFQEHIANVFQSVLGFPVEVRISLSSFSEERHQDCGSWISTGDSVQKEIGLSGSTGRMQPGDSSSKSYPPKPRTTKGDAVNNLGGASECFPAISKAPFSFLSKEIQHSDVVSLSHEPYTEVAEDPHLGIAREEPPTDLYTGNASARGGHTMVGGVRNKHLTALEGALTNVNNYMQDLEYDALHNDGERNIATDIEMLSLESSQVASINENDSWSKYGGLAQNQYYINRRRSCCDADVQKGKDNIKVASYVKGRNSTRILPSSDPNSPIDQESTCKAPRSGIKSYTEVEKDEKTAKGSEPARDSFEASSNATLTQKKTKLKGAAGSFARLFQGRTPKQGPDMASQ